MVFHDLTGPRGGVRLGALASRAVSVLRLGRAARGAGRRLGFLAAALAFALVQGAWCCRALALPAPPPVACHGSAQPETPVPAPDGAHACCLQAALPTSDLVSLAGPAPLAALPATPVVAPPPPSRGAAPRPWPADPATGPPRHLRFCRFLE
ncbi:MAG: hypothetical protein KatS3mg121_0098 [Gammaproteobacteria bacterium]|nr:MAG: hypothetical protein KatS3mg121_0098 [Gammaproteobacteria bacterium]